MKEIKNYLSVALDDLPDRILVVLDSTSDQGLQDEANAILRSMGGWWDAYIITVKNNGEAVSDVNILDIEESSPA